MLGDKDIQGHRGAILVGVGLGLAVGAATTSWIAGILTAAIAYGGFLMAARMDKRNS